MLASRLHLPAPEERRRWRKRGSGWHWRGCRVIGLSVDKVEDHLRWAADIEDLAGTKLDYPLIADEDLSIAKRYDMRCAPGAIHPKAAPPPTT